MKNIELKDSGVEFNAEDHTYKYNGKILKGITGTLINRAYPVDETYKDVDEAVLKHAAERGSACHQSVGNLYTIEFRLQASRPSQTKQSAFLTVRD